MGSENEENKKCGFEDVVIPEEVRLTYFPKQVTKFVYDVLPLFELSEYMEKLANEVLILKNPVNAKKWEEFMKEMPQACLKYRGLDKSKVAVFANYRRQKVSHEYLTSSIKPPSPDAIFRRQK